MNNFDLKKIAEKSNSWPFVEARNLRDRLVKFDKDSQKVVLFETGYGPSGLPHIGCLLYTSPSPRDATLSRMPSSA